MKRESGHISLVKQKKHKKVSMENTVKISVPDSSGSGVGDWRSTLYKPVSGLG